jgi:CHAT domain-containing protein
MKFLTPTNGRSVCGLSFLLVLIMLGYSLAWDTSSNPVVAKAQENPEIRIELKIANPIKEQLGAGQQKTYQLDLRAGQYVRIIARKGDTNLRLAISDPDASTLGEFVSYRFEPFSAAFIARKSGTHHVAIQSLEKNATAREIILTLEELRTATERDEIEVQALATTSEARKLQAQWTGVSSRMAIERFEKAAVEWRSGGRKDKAASALLEAGEVSFGLSAYTKALEFYGRALSLAREANDTHQIVTALSNLGFVHANTDNNERAEFYLQEALPLCQKLTSQSGELDHSLCMAQVQNNLGEVYYYRGDLTGAKLQFSRSLELFTKSGDRRGEALVHLNLGYSYLDAGAHNSQAHLAQALSLSLDVGDRRLEVLTNTARGLVFSFKGEKQNAFDAYKTGLELARIIGDRQAEASILNSTGKAYEDLNEPQSALENYKQALKIFQGDLNRDAEAVTFCYLGRATRSLGNEGQALDYYQQCLSMCRELKKQRIENFALTEIASMQARQGAHQAALAEFRKALRFSRKQDDKRGQANLLNHIGDVYLSLGDWPKAASHYQKALDLNRKADDQWGVVSMLYKVARAQREAGNNAQALSLIEEAMRMSESLRFKISRQDLRSSFFASVHDQVELYIQLLMQLHDEDPAKGYAIKAFEASEAARARTLLELLVTANIDLRKGLAPELLERERVVEESLASMAQSQVAMLRKGATDAELKQTEEETSKLTTTYQEIQAEISQEGLRNATLAQSSALRLADIQQEVLDDDTLLLEYFLGEETSYLWAITSTSLHSYKLGSRKELENLARDVYTFLSATDESASSASAVRSDSLDQQYWQRASKMSDALLGKAASDLKGKKRLLVVADGALQYIPFDALPSPNSQPVDQAIDVNSAAPLLLDYEVVNVPSASTLATVKRRNNHSEISQQLLAVLADPVFESDDPRLQQNKKQKGTGQQPSIEGLLLRSALKSIVRGDNAHLSRLPFTLQEAEAIMTAAPQDAGTILTGFSANRNLVVNGGLREYRIIHFATHGVINCEHPELSGIVLSMLNERGEPENGFLQLHDIYRLELSADLVVLSACRTGLGQEIRGEGLVGLTQGFFYRGANIVVSTLWTIDDRASAELMQHFYEAILQEGVPSASALRSAKLKMLTQKRWQSPYYWAAFVVQGDYQHTIKLSARRSDWPVKTIVFVVLSAGIVAIAIRWGLTRRRRAH